MREYLKLAYRKGHDTGVRDNVPEHEVGFAEEALDWQKVAIFGRIGRAVGRVARVGTGVVKGGRQAQQVAAGLGRRAAESGYGRQLMLGQLGATGAGAGIGALAGGEGQRGRGALIGALSGMGLGMGARMGGLKSLGKGIRAYGGQAGRMVQAGKMAPGQVGAFMKKQILQSPYKHRFARQMVGAGTLGAAGAAGAGALGSALVPKKPQAGPQHYGQYGQALGMMPQYAGIY